MSPRKFLEPYAGGSSKDEYFQVLQESAMGLPQPAGTYQRRISAPAYRVDEHSIRLCIVDGATLLYGTFEFSDDALNPGVRGSPLAVAGPRARAFSPIA